MIGPAERKSMRQHRTHGVKNEKSPAKSQPHFSRPRAEKNSQRDANERRHDGTRKIERIFTQWRERHRQRYNQVIERRSRMRRSSARKIFKIMSPDDRARVFEANARACHPRITIGINEIDLAAEEDVTVIRTPADENQRADENDFRQEREAPPHAPFKSAIRIPQSEIFIESIRDWSHGVCYVLLSHRCGPVAQRLEQGTHNPLVPGSNPGGPILHARADHLLCVAACRVDDVTLRYND